MTSKHTRIIAFVMAALLFINTAVFPVTAEGSLDAVTETEVPVTVTEAPTEAPPVSTEASAEIPTEAPTEAPTETPTEAPTQAPTDAPTQAPTDAPTEAPTEETGVPETEAPTDPTEETAGETEAPTEPTEETEPTEPELDEAALWAAQEEGYLLAIQYYQSMMVTGERNMPLEWWYALTGQTAMREPDLSSLLSEQADGQPEAAGAEPGANGDWSAYVVFPESIIVHSARELILLSHVASSEYDQRAITLLADAGLEFDLTASVRINEGSEWEQVLTFRGLGGLDYPFGGTIRFGTLSENIYFILSAPLFNGIFCDARFVNLENQRNPVRLVSKAEYSFDGLLATHVLGDAGTPADWSVLLFAPEAGAGKHFCLPSILGVMYGNATVNLNLTDLSQLAPSARGYLCATMYRQTTLRATNINRDVSVPLVGELDPNATLISDAPSAPDPTEAPTEATGVPMEEPTEEATAAPTEEPTAAATEAPTVEPTVEATAAPTEEPTQAPTEPGVLVDEAALLEMAIAFYRSLEVVPGEMSLEWWYVVTDQAIPGTAEAALVMNGAEFLRFLEETQTPLPTLPAATAPEEAFEEVTVPDEIISEESTVSETAEAQSPAATEAESELSVHSGDADSAAGVYAIAAYAGTLEDAGLTPGADSSISIGSTNALVALSNVDASQYQDKTLKLALNESTGDTKYVATSAYSFRGLGSEGVPFQGKIFLDDLSSAASIQLDGPLFNSIADSAEVTKLNLESAIQNSAEGLLARTVTSAGGGQSWTVNLVGPTSTDPDTEPTYYLPPLIGTMKAQASVSLTVTDGSGLTVNGSGYLCGVMEENSTLTAAGLPDAITVNGSGSDTGSLVGSMGNSAKLDLTLADSFAPTVTASGGNVGGLIGSMGSKTMLTISSTVTANVTCSGTNAGGLVGSMGSEADLNISSAPNITVANNGGTAGGLVGSMSSGAALTLSSEIWIKKVEAKTYAGGIAGVCKNPEFTFTDGALLSGTGSTSMVYSSGGVAVGGIAGQLTWSIDKDEMALLPIQQLLITNGDAGGLYGEVKNGGKALTFSYQGSLFTNVILEGRRESKGAVGGLIGWLDGSGAASCTLTVKAGIIVEVTAARAWYLGGLVGAPDNCTHIMNLSGNVILHGVKNVTDVGGLVGISRRSQAKVEISNLTVETDGFDSGSIGSYGGLFGELEDYGSYVYIGENVDLSETTVVGTGSSGGLIGGMASGVLYLAENPKLPTSSSATNVNQRGWVVGNRGNTLVCAAKEWEAVQSDAFRMNDTNRWGQVLQLTKFEPNLIRLDRENRTVTIGDLPGQTDGAYTIGSLTDFAAVALRLQLSPKNSLIIPNDINNGASVSLKLTASISLEGTGLTGLTRDHSSCELFHISLDGGGNSITHPSMKVYTSSDAHNRQGLIARAGRLELSNLTFTGTGSIEAINDETSTGIACYVDGDVSLTDVTSSVVWNFSGSASSSKLSGMVAEVTTDDKNVAFKNCTWNGIINDSTSGANNSAGFLAYLNKKGTAISVEDCTVSGQIIREASTGEAPVGGLISRIQGSDTTLKISNLMVKRAKITVKKPQYQWADKCGGLLGYEWKDTDATFTGVSIENSTLETDRKFGGLVYMGSGHWILTEDNGITFTGSTFSGESDDGTPSGLLVSIGTNDPALYLEVLYNSFSDEGAAVTLTGQSSYFDSLVGKSINDGRSDAIVSIATARIAEGGLPLIDQGSCNTYQSVLSKAHQNPCTRYDYNLCFYDKAAAGQIDTAGEMVLWSAMCRANSSIAAYFNFAYSNKITGQIDLTGYAFYPVPYEGTSIENATITFDFKGLEEVEGNNTNKTPSDKLHQHAGMHTGIFTEANGNGTLSVSELTLCGTVGGYDGKYGAIIRGSAHGGGKNSVLTLSIHGVNLDGIRVYPVAAADFVQPLLIHSIGSYTTLNMSGVKTVPDKYGTDAAASSLIGRVGDENSDYIQLTFSDMLLEQTGNKNGTCQIFTRAMFLESFQYGGNNCRGAYDFERNDDNYTLGREISNTTGGTVSGRNNGEQYWFFRENGKDAGYVCTVIGQSKEAAGTAFESYPRYVYIKEGADGAATYHEIDINLESPDLLIGCGTYSHPYLITSGKQLEALSQAIVTGGKRSGWKVKVNDPVLATVKNGNRDFSQQDGHTGNASDEEEEVLSNETVYTSSTDGWSASGKEDTATDAQMLEYLRNAYYQISGEITLSSWSGLGEESLEKRFSGVITGRDGAKVIISSSANVSQFGGLVKFSQGSVIKNLAINFTKPENGCLIITCSNAPSSTTDASFFGGVVGWCTGGDTVIDNVSVSYENGAVVAAGSMHYLAAMGGYVGLVGGANNLAGGGVVFRNITDSTTGFSANDGYYSNPYIGRVMDGFALSENGGLGYLDSNYYIPNVSDASLSINGSNATVNNGAGLWVLAAMINSSGGTRGKGRCGNYSSIGTVVTQDFLSDEKPGSSLYLSKFSNGDFFTSDSLSLTLAGDCDVSGYGNGFRGIGADHGSGHRALKLLAADGNGHTITMAQKLFQYAEESNGWRLIAAGLFPDPSITTSNVTIENLLLSGSIAMNYWKFGNTEPNSWELPETGFGMLIGNYMDNSSGATLTLSNVRAVDAEVSGNLLNIGGLVGRVMSHWGFTLQIENSGYENLTASGYANVGGLVGFVQCNSIQITDSSCTGGKIQLTNQFSWNDGAAVKYGVGGLAGNIVTSSATIRSSNDQGPTFSGTNVISNIAYKKNEIGVGGLVGFWCIASGNSAAVENIRFSGNLTVGGAGVSSVGGLAGYICAQNDANNWQSNSGGFNFSASNIYIAAEADSHITLTSGHQAGGLMGMYSSGAATTNAFTMDKIHIGAEVAQNVTVTGVTSAASLVATLCKAPAVKVSNVFLNGNIITADSYTALLFGSADNQTSVNLGLSVWNVEADGCTLNGGNSATNNVKKNPGTGFLYGSRGSNGKGFTVDGYNILVKNSTITQNQNNSTSYPSNCAIWGGVNVDGKAVRLVAVRVQDCSAPAQDFASGASNCYAIRANYMGAADVKTIDASPYVPSNPLSPLGTLDGTAITGDGASFWTDGTSIGKKIQDEASTTDCNAYFNAATAAGYFSVKEKSDLISDYAAGGGNGTLDSSQTNFPVLVVPADTNGNVTAEITNYITLLTNETEWNSLKPQIHIRTYKWSGSGFAKQDTASLSWDGSNFSVAKGRYDNQLDQFTLLDVQFTNSTGSGPSCYHLYIPVIVRKELEFRFWVAAEVGTNYYVSAYDNLSTPAIGSHGEPVTALIGFEYLRTQEEWQAAVDNGENLLWSFDKELTITHLNEAVPSLPEGTKLTLVDRNNQSKAYFFRGSVGSSLSFSSFSGWKADRLPLCDSLGLTAKETNDGSYVQTNEKAEATLRIDGVYYRLASDEDPEEAARYAVTVHIEENIKEQYYLTILTPAGTESIPNFLITHGPRLTAPDGYGMPTRMVKNEGGKPNVRQKSENQIILGNLFKQIVTVESDTSNELMSSSNNAINATLKSVISFNSDYARDVFTTYGSNKAIYQRFDLVLKLCEGSSEKQVNFASGTSLRVTYKRNGSEVGNTSTVLGGGASARLVFPESGINVSDLNKDLVLTAELELTYTDPGIIGQFPTRGSDDSITGILVCANSYLAYSRPSLEQNSSPESARDTHNRHYYRQEAGATNLHYVATGSDLNQLGINGLTDSTPAAINSAAQYELSALNATAQAKQLHCAVKLQYKDDNGNYQDADVPFTASIGATVVGVNGSSGTFDSQKGVTVTFTLANGIDNSIPIQIFVTLQIGTGSALENASGFYSNYRVVLTAELLSGSGNVIPSSSASDYIVYTNAKIITELIR